jgi:hypothetical protein
MATVKPGERLRCTECGTEVVIIKADGVAPRCCGKAMESRSATTASVN